jgi:hypothetical protein
MAMKNIPARAALVAALMGSVAWAPMIAAADTKIGVAAATNANKAAPNVTGQPPAGEKRIVEVGTNVLADERIVTNATGQAQFLFSDGSSFSVGPDSDLTLDKFVYDPEKGTGEMSLSVTKGVLRFVGGKISKTNPVQVKVGNATMGIRGGIATLNYQPGQPIIAKFLFGKEMSMTANGVTQVTTRPGTAIDTPPGGGAPSPPRTVSAQEMRQTMSAMEAKPAAAPAASEGGGGGGQQQAAGGQQQSSGGQSEGGGGQQPAGGQSDSGGGQQQAAAPASGGGGDAPPAAPPPAQIESRLDSSGLSNANSGGGTSIVPTVNPITGGNAGPGSSPVPQIDNVADAASDSTNNAANDAAEEEVQEQTQPTNFTTTFAGARGRTVVNGGISSINTVTLAATQDAANNLAVSGFTTTTTGGVTTLALTAGSAIGTISIPVASSGTTLGNGFFFDVLDAPATLTESTFSGFGYRATSLSDFQYYSLEGFGGEGELIGPHGLGGGSVAGFGGGGGSAQGGGGRSFEIVHYSGTPTAAAAFPTTGFGQHSGFGPFGLASVPFGGVILDSNIESFSASPILSRYNSNLNPLDFDVQNARAAILQGTVGITGQGGDQTSFMSGMTGFYAFDGAGGITATGGMQGSIRTGAGSGTQFLRSNVAAAETAGGGSAIFGSAGQFMVFTPDIVTLDTETGTATRTPAVIEVTTNAPGSGSGGFTGQGAVTGATSVTPSALLTNATRSTRSMTGFAGGLVENRVSGTLQATDERLRSTSATILMHTNATTNRLEASFDARISDSNFSTTFGSLSGNLNSASSAFINDRQFGARNTNQQTTSFFGTDWTANGMMITSDLFGTVDDSFFPSGVAFCTTCEDLVWGFWSSNFSNATGGEFEGEVRSLHLASFVVGDRTSNVTSSRPNGTASYTGHMLGNVRNGASRYLAIGNYTQNWNFATRSGSMAVANFDGFSIFGNLGSEGSEFSGSLTGAPLSSGPTLTGSLNGSFFDGNRGSAMSVGGGFELSGTNYQAAGTFAAGGTFTAPTITSFPTAVAGRTIFGNGELQPFSGFNNQTLAVAINDDANFGYNAALQTVNSGGFNAITVGTPEDGDFVFPVATGASGPIGDSFNILQSLTPFGSLTGTGFRATNLNDFYYVSLGFAGGSSDNAGFINFAGVPTTASAFPTTGLQAHSLTSFLGGGIPFAGDLLATVNGTPAAPVLYSAYNSTLSPTQINSGPERAVNLFGSINIHGQGSAQSSFMVGQTGTYIDNPDGGIVAAGGVQGSVRADGSQSTTRLASAASTAPVGNSGETSAIFGATGEYMVFTPDNVNIDSENGDVFRISQAGFAQPLTDLNGSSYYFADLAVQVTTAPSILVNTARSTRLSTNLTQLNGYMAGLIESRNPGGVIADTDRIFHNLGSTASDFVLETDATTNRLRVGVDLLTGVESSAQLEFGSIAGPNNARSSYINDRLYGARDSTVSPTLVDGTPVQARSLLMSYDVSPVTDPSFFPAGVSFCTTCTDITFGWALTDLRHDDNTRERIHLATYVAGTVTDSIFLPVEGTASFGGHMIGNVQNGASRYLAIGHFTQVWNFGQRNGVINVDSFDGFRLGTAIDDGTGRSGNASSNFSGVNVFSAGGQDFQFDVNGTFFSGFGSGAAAVGGQFRLFDTEQVAYQAAGTFAAGPATVQSLTGFKGRFFRDVNGGPTIYSGFNASDLSVTLNAAQTFAVGSGTAGGEFTVLDSSWLRVPTSASTADNLFLRLDSGGEDGSTTVTDLNVLTPFGSHTGTYFMDIAEGASSPTFFATIMRDSLTPQNVTGVFGGLPTTLAQMPTSGLRAQEMRSGADDIPFLSDLVTSLAPGAVAGATISPLFSAYAPVTTGTTATTTDVRSSFMQVSLGISGQGGEQSSLFAGATGFYLREDATDGPVAAGKMRGMYRGNGEERPIFATSGLATADVGGASAVFGASADYLVFVPDQMSFNSGNSTITRTNGAGAEFTFTGPNSSPDYYFVDFARPMAAPTVLSAPSRTSQTLQGYVGGLVETRTSGGSLNAADGMFANENNSPLDVSVTTNATNNRIEATFNLTDNTGTGNTFGLNFGSTTSVGGADSAFINDALFAASDSSSAPSTINNSSTGVTARGVMVSHAVAPIAASSFAPNGVDFCDCNFMQWGWWTSNVSQSSGAGDRFHLSTWVAGVLPSLAEIPNTGTASYSGHAIGNVNNNGTRYVAMGNFTKNWDFGTRTGTATISNFDNLTVNFANSSANGRDFAGSLAAGSTAGVTAATMTGSFFKSPTDTVAGTGGNFAIAGSNNYQASGTFLAKK